MKTKFGFDSGRGEDTEWYSVREEPFDLYGLLHIDGQFRRIPQDVADATNGGVSGLSRQTAGGRVRFTTDSPFVVINARMPMMEDYAHFARTGSTGFDLYIKTGDRFVFFRPFFPEKSDWCYECYLPMPSA